MKFLRVGFLPTLDSSINLAIARSTEICRHITYTIAMNIVCVCVGGGGMGVSMEVKVVCK
jgi:hypothetical protein